MGDTLEGLGSKLAVQINSQGWVCRHWRAQQHVHGFPHAAALLAVWLDALRLGFSAAHTRRAILGFHPGIRAEGQILHGQGLLLRLLATVQSGGCVVCLLQLVL